MSGDNKATTGLIAKLDKKRKRQAEEPSKKSKPDAPKSKDSTTEGPQNKKQKSGKNKGKKDKKDDADKPKVVRGEPLSKERKGISVDEAIGKMDGRLLADHFVQKAKRHNKEITAVELNDLSVPGMSAPLNA